MDQTGIQYRKNCARHLQQSENMQTEPMYHQQQVILHRTMSKFIVHAEKPAISHMGPPVLQCRQNEGNEICRQLLLTIKVNKLYPTYLNRN